MRKSAAVKLTLVPMLAASALAYADPPGQTAPVAPLDPSVPADTWVQTAPVPNEPAIELMPPALTPTIEELDCDSDPNWYLRDDCEDVEGGRTGGIGVGVVRGGYGHYFWTGGG